MADVEWLQSFDSSVEIRADETRQMEDDTVLNVHTDQSGIAGLVRRISGLGMLIKQDQIITTNFSLVILAVVQHRPYHQPRQKDQKIKKGE